jgi:hypothetical protein
MMCGRVIQTMMVDLRTELARRKQLEAAAGGGSSSGGGGGSRRAGKSPPALVMPAMPWRAGWRHVGYQKRDACRHVLGLVLTA